MKVKRTIYGMSRVEEQVIQLLGQKRIRHQR